MAIYNWQQKDWPDFSYDPDGIKETLYLFAEKTGHVGGILLGLPADLQLETFIDMMVAEAIKSSAIEGEYLNRNDVMSSIRNNLGLNIIPERVPDNRAIGIGELMIDVRNSFREPMTREKLFSWHKMLMLGSGHVNAGAWRTHAEPMQVISGSHANPKIHYEAPPSAAVPSEMEKFINWFNDTAPGQAHEIKMPPIRAAIAHLYFETIHPFEDGNGRIGRAIAEKALSQGIGRPALLSLSKTIEKNKKDYYNALEHAQKNNEITAWLVYFVNTILTAQQDAEQVIGFTLKKVKFYDRFSKQLNERQLAAISRMLEEGPDGFAGGMSAKKYMIITKTSKATATRDLQDLAVKTAFIPFGEGGGRSTKYQVNL
ncbi:MAG: Fic family protein [Chitinophagaceae bacterium]|nr:MAG: Fic family protein [Chitinophagaceae bacterium]